MSALIPPGPAVPQALASILQSFYDAISDLQNPGAPSQLAHIDTKAHLVARYPAASYQGGVLICDDINSIVHSTKVTGTWTWLRANGSAL